MPAVQEGTATRRSGAPPPGTPPAKRHIARLLKHALDRVIALTGLVVTAPLTLGLALALRLLDPGPVLRRDVRLGEGGRRIDVLSFHVGEQLHRRSFWRLVAGSALTTLPQLWNVLRGELSLVGPRPRDPGLPPPPARPGLTGAVQVEQLVRRVTAAEALALDEDYARSWSLLLDARIVVLTMWRSLVS
jgi:lipopolysaccharide/colanic/teichoic acid biosynthesis glycosyltransferase